MLKKIIWILILWIVLMGCSQEEKWEKNKEINKEEQKIILALWDSVTAGYNLDISQSYPSLLQNILQENKYQYEVINAWVSGDTSKNLLDRIGLYSDVNVEIYFLTIGGNDGLRRQNTKNMKKNIQATIDAILEQNNQAKIVIWGMKLPINYGLKYSKEFQKVYEELATENKLEFFPHFLKDVQQKPNLNLSDGIHPNMEWYKIIAQNIYEFLEVNNIISK